jgi:hypothetical protein
MGQEHDLPEPALRALNVKVPKVTTSSTLWSNLVLFDASRALLMASVSASLLAGKSGPP